MVIYRVNPVTTHFLNVDLDIYSKADLQPLVTALGKKVFVLYVGRIRQTHCAHLELAKITRTADATMRGFCSLIEALPRLERDLWNAAKVRDFNIGVQAGTQPHSTEFALAAETLKAAHELSARVVFTVYATEQPRKPVAKGRTHSKKAAATHPETAV
jgi:hypothetical protein